MPNPDTIACIIPAYNEQSRIVDVVRAALDAELFDHITVVDDASTDYTVWALENTLLRPGPLRGIRLAYHAGKSRAVAHGMTLSPRCKFVCLLDADLIGLRPEDLHSLVRPVALGNATVSISRRGRGSGFWPNRLDILSGERVLPWWMLEAAQLHTQPPMGMEMAINDVIIGARAPVAVVQWPHVTNPTKWQKHGLLGGIAGEARMYRDLIKKGVWTLGKQTRMLNRLVVENG
jgi:glycosyltransferase involved in cell wall biosynthesis